MFASTACSFDLMYRVGIVGLGKIAEAYGTPGDPSAYCHAGGVLHSDRVELTAVADLSSERLSGFGDKWGPAFPAVSCFASATTMLAESSLDIVAVCVRGPHHFAVMREVIAASPRAIFLEKPPTCSLAEMDGLFEAAAVAHIPITVSYSRHWTPHLLQLQDLVSSGLVGDVQTVVGYVGGFILSMTSHVTDQICQFAGYCPETVFARGRYRDLEEDLPPGYEPEPNLDALVIEFANGVTGIQIGENGDHGGLYCDIIGTRGRVRAGMYIAPYARDHKNREIDLSGHGCRREETSVFTVAYGQIADYLDGGPLPHCTDQHAALVNEIGFGAIESVIDGRLITLPVENRQRRIHTNG